MSYLKFLLVTACFIFMNEPALFAQFKTEFGVVTLEETELKECEFEPDAPAVVLVDEGLSDHEGNLRGLMTFQHTRLKILKEEAIHEAANFSLTYTSENDVENVDYIRAVVINFDENKKISVTEVDQKAMYRRKISASESEVAFAFPNVKVGSIIEYSYRFRAKSYWQLKDWTFQSRYPVYRSSYELKMSPSIEMSYAVQKRPEYNITIKPSKATNSIFFEMRNIPGLRAEPFMASRRDNLQMVFFEVSKYDGVFGTERWMSTWDEVTEHLHEREDFGSQLKMKIRECDEYVETLAGKPDFEKMKMIHEYVRKNLSWNYEYRVVSPKGIRDAWQKKSGNSASINLLMINMLKTAGLEAYPMLVSERPFGRINKEKPFINQFNTVYASVRVEGKNYYLDAIDKFTPTHLIPYAILNTTCFIANKKNGGLVFVESPDARYRDVITVQADITDDNRLKGTVTIQSRDYSRAEKLKFYKEDKTNYVEKKYKNSSVTADVANFKIDNIDTDSLPLIETFDFSGNLQQTSDYWFLPMNVFSGYSRSPFLDLKRFSDINFGYKKSITLNYIINLPASKKADALVKNIQMVNADKSLLVSRSVSYIESAHQVVARVKIEQNKGLYSAAEYEDIKEFFKKMSNLLEEQCVIKNK